MKRDDNNKQDTLQIVHMLDMQRAEIARLREQLAILTYHHEQAELRYRKALVLAVEFAEHANILKTEDVVLEAWIKERDRIFAEVRTLLDREARRDNE